MNSSAAIRDYFLSAYEERQSLGDTLFYDVIQDAQRLEQISHEWQEICKASNGATVFQSWEWCNIILKLNKDNSDFEPFVLTARRKGRLVAFLPLKKIYKTGRKILTGLAEPFQQYTEILTSDALDTQAVIKAWLPMIRDSGCDLLHLGQVRKDSCLARSIDDLLGPSGETDAAPYVPLDHWPDFETYFKSIKSKTRKNMRNAINRLEKTAPVTHKVHTQGEEFTAIVNRTFTMRKTWLRTMGLTSRAFNDDEFWKFLDQVCRLAEKPNSDFGLIGMSLKHGDKPIAEQWGITYRGRYYAFISGWDQEYDASSPGKLHLGEVIRTCYEKQMTVVDFLMPTIAYKKTWTKNEVEVQDYVLPITPVGFIYNTFWLNFLRPLAKACVLKIPVHYRTKLFTALGWS